MPSTADFNPICGLPYALARDLTLVLAPNPSEMTGPGTNTYLLGTEKIVIIDPGPADRTHLEAVLAAVDGRPVSHILVTHSHKDHSLLARPIADATGAPICAFGNSETGRTKVMSGLVKAGFVGGGEGVDSGFTPDIWLRDGQIISAGCGDITALHTPGHMGNHMCFEWQRALFCGDHVMGWASSVISPPDGDIGDFRQSCAKLGLSSANPFYPAHGAPLYDPGARLDWLVQHRKKRENEIVETLLLGPATPAALAVGIYHDIPPTLVMAAERNVFAHLLDLVQRGLVSTDAELAPDATFRLKTPRTDGI